MSTVLPVYYQIKQTLKHWIINKEFNPGDKIPSEKELAEKFHVSRLTVRQAISQLAGEGFLYSRRGEGTFVTHDERLINRSGLETAGFMDELFSHKPANVKTRSVSIAQEKASKSVQDKLKLQENEDVTHIKRVRWLSGRLFAYTINFLPVEIGTRICKEDLYQRKLMDILEHDLGIEFKEAVQTIEASFADQEVAEKLEVLSGSPILFVEKIMYDRNQKPVELFQSSYRADLYKFIVRLIKVKRGNSLQWVHHPDEAGGDARYSHS